MIVKNKENTLDEAPARENNRSRRLKRNIIGSLLVKGGSIAIGLFLIPMTIHYVSPPQYGVWLTLSSIIGWFSFFDIGFGHGLRNKFAEAVAKEDYTLAKTYVSTTYAVLTMIVTTVLLLFLLVNPFLNWAAILNAPASMAGDLQTIGLIVLSCFCVQMVVQLMSTIVIANQQPAIASLITFSGNLISLAVIFLLTRFTNGSLLHLSITFSASPLIAFTVASLWLYNGRYRQFRPSLKLVNFAHAGKLMSLGLKFFVLQIGAVILFQTNNIIISQLFGPEQVTSYNIAYRYFGSAFMFFGIIVSPFWSASTEAWVKQDIAWIKGIIRKLKNIFFLLTALLAGMLLISKPVYDAWIGEEVKIPFQLSMMVAICTALQIWQSIFLQFLNGISKVMLQLYLMILFSAINIPLAVFLGKQIGIAGVVLSSVILFSMIGTCMYFQTEKIINHKARGIWNR